MEKQKPIKVAAITVNPQDFNLLLAHSRKSDELK